MIFLVLQVVLAVPAQVVTWQQSAMTPSQAQGYSYKLYIQEESGLKKVVQLVNTLCGTGPNGIPECSTALPPAGNAAIVSNNYSQLSATDPTTKAESQLSGPFKGNQGCILRDNLYKITQRTTLQANKNTLNALLNEFKAAKFQFISQTQKGNQFQVTEECVGHL